VVYNNLPIFTNFPCEIACEMLVDYHRQRCKDSHF